MNRTATALAVAVLLVVAGVAVPAVMAQSAGTATETSTGAETGTATPDGTDARSNGSANASAGERLQGTIGAQEAEIDGEIRTRRFGIRTARAASDDATAAVVADELTDVEARLDELEERRQRLRRARDAGTISQGRHRAEMARLAVETGTVAALANESADAAEDLPPGVRDRAGIDIEEIRGLSERAGDLERAVSVAGGPDGVSGRTGSDEGARDHDPESDDGAEATGDSDRGTRRTGDGRRT